MTDIENGIRAIEKSGLVDSEWYLARYPDVVVLGMGAAEHYFRIGATLLRDPSPLFSTGYYLASHADVVRSGMNPLLHYLHHGRAEKRPCSGLEQFDDEEIRRLRDAFDASYYLGDSPEGAPPVDFDPLQHYLSIGWREGRDPSPEFSTSYYLERAPDVRRPGVNPFPHYVLKGRKERRRALPFHRRLALREFHPMVSVIIPNYNHGRFLEQRIESILNQTWQNFEILILDDCSSDDSREIIGRYCARDPARIRSILNTENSGNVFRQWRKGVENSRGELIWICESDDFCEPDFLAQLIPCFKDRSVNIAFGRIQFSDRDGLFKPGLDQYREGAERGIWGQSISRPASEWFANGFGVNNVIANVGGCVWRRQILQPDVWNEAETYSVLGDWYLYCEIAGGGQIAYEPGAVAYFRQHGENTSVVSFRTPRYYTEHQRLMTFLKQRWDIPASTVHNFHGKIAHQYAHFGVAEKFGSLDQYVDEPSLTSIARTQPHILIAFLGFHSGGGEIFPIHLANALHRRGCLVSMMALDMLDYNADIAALLDPAIPVYDSDNVYEIGVDAFMAKAAVSLIHSHMLSLEWFFFEACKMQTPIPYLVTMHGSYEASSASDEVLARLLPRVDHWVYTADRNLERLRGVALSPARLSKGRNAMPMDPRPFPLTREQMGIAEDAVVFTLVARGIKRKGWRVLIDAFMRLRASHPDRNMHLLLCGDGPETDRHSAAVGTDPQVTFLGFQSCIHGLYRLSDCAVIPTRFAGESYPLCLIQAMQVGTPIIATRTGEIANMIGEGGQAAGLLLEPDRDTGVFTGCLAAAMSTMLAASTRDRFREASLAMGSAYDMDALARSYVDLYERLLIQANPARPTNDQHARL